MRGTHAVKQVRFMGRVSRLRGYGTWIHFPARGLWQEIVPGVCPGKWSPTGRAMFCPSLAVYDRELFDMSEGDFERFLQWHPATVRRYHATFNKADPDGGLVDAGHFAIHEDKVG